MLRWPVKQTDTTTCKQVKTLKSQHVLIPSPQQFESFGREQFNLATCKLPAEPARLSDSKRESFNYLTLVRFAASAQNDIYTRKKAL